MTSHRKLIAIGVLLVVTTMPVHAHHSRVNFLQEVVAFQATVTRVEWVNPHVYIYVEALDQNGVMMEWEVETQSTPNVIRRGWTPESLRSGDVITIRANADKNPEKRLLFGITFTKEDGTVLPSQGTAGRVVIEDVPSSDGLAGIWETVGFGAGPRDTAATHLPLTEKALAATVGFNVSQHPMVQCIPPTPPGNMGGPYLHAVEIYDDVVILNLEYNGVTRTVHMDGREHPNDIERTNQGHSIGWWEGDVLVIDTVAIADHRWGTGRGVPSGAERHVVERYTLSDDGTMVTIDYVVEDPEYLTEPISGTIRWQHAPHLEMLPFDCNPEIAQRFVVDS